MSSAGRGAAGLALIALAFGALAQPGPEATGAVPLLAVPVRSAPAGPPLVDLLQWPFKYRGRGIHAEGIVVTYAKPRADGAYQIVAIEGRRNRREIVALEPAGELITSRGYMFSDNRLEQIPPYLTQSGFSFRTKQGRVFNVCFAGPYEGCGESGYQEHDSRSYSRPIEFELQTRPTPIAAIDPLPPDPPSTVASVAGCEEAVQTQASSWSVDSIFGFALAAFASAPAQAKASADSRCDATQVSGKYR
jgi:hypothetical protein